MVIFALVLELDDEDYFKDRHQYDKRGEDRELVFNDMTLGR